MAAEFLLAKASYKAMTGREQKQGEDVLCYQIRQSFYPGEITPEEANRVSYELAMRWTKGRHAFIVTTHTDKEHIHSHIYYNSTTLDCTRKFRNFWGSSFALRRLSDRLCLENGLSIVENPKPRSKGKFRNYGEWLAGRKRPLTYQDRLRAVIDTALAKRPADFPEFLSLMEQSGYEVKQRRGAVSFRAPGQERFTRLRSDTLGDGYGEADIRAAISGSRQRPGQPRQKVSLAIDIQSRLQGKGPGYERWAKVFNLKQMAAALAYLQDNGLTDYEQLEQKATAATERFHKLSDQIKSTEVALHTNMELKAATVQYAKSRPVFEKYKASKYSRKFLAEHEADIELYRAACADFKRILDGGKLPKMDALKEEGRKLAEQKKKLYAEYRKAKADMQEVTTIKANIDYLLGYLYQGRDVKEDKDKSLKDQILVIAPHEGFVPSDIWLRCRKKLMTNITFQNGRKARNTWLAGKIKCGKCGYALKTTHNPSGYEYLRCSKRADHKGCPGCGTLRKNEFEQFIFSAMGEKFREFKLLRGGEEKANPKITAYQVELAQVEAEIEKLLDTLTGANATLLAYANKKIEDLDNRRKTLSKAIADLSVETLSSQQIELLSGYLDDWENISFEDKRKAADGLISSISATSDYVKIEWKI